MTRPKYTVWEITSRTTSRCLTDSTKPHDYNCGFAGPSAGFPQYAVFDGGQHIATFRTLDGLLRYIPNALPFKIDGPGKYQRKDGVIVQIFGRNPLLTDTNWPWCGVCGDDPRIKTWNTSGQYGDEPSDEDIIAKVED